MEISIYQVNLNRDTNGVAFDGYEQLPLIQKTQDIDASIYDKVYSCRFEKEDLEEVYRVFNTEHPEDYKGRSLSVSDVVEIITETPQKKTATAKGCKIEDGFYYCDSIGFRKIDFEKNRAVIVDKELSHPDIPVPKPTSVRNRKNETMER